ncbi:hypothetical protein LTR28_004440 [Elasticomyces elasticus]|nr:hypothetical protein LTR28_004440 [Elasticomyces elasticus]
MALRSQFNDLTSNPRHASWLCPLLITLDAALCGLIIWRIPYTEIDWRAYMQQVSQYIAGERDYVKIYGATGPLVYPAAHVYIYRALHAVTDGGEDVLLAQVIFAVVYLVALSLVMACYRAAKRRLWTMGSVSYSVGLGVKMSLLLALPAVAVVLFQALGPQRALKQAGLMGQLQALMSRHVTPRFILTAVLSANAIGMLCARSLHYQFYSWIAWATPFLLWRAGFHPVLQYALWAAQEWAWNVYPSTGSSSMVVVAVLGVMVAGVCYGARELKQQRVE